MREMQIFDYKKKIAEAETKLKQQQNLYEAVRSDRNLYSKNLIESQVRKMWLKDKTPQRESDQCHQLLTYLHIACGCVMRKGFRCYVSDIRTV